MKIALSSSHGKDTHSLMPDTLANPSATPNLDKAVEYELNHGCKFGPKMDVKKLRRIISNRLSSKRSRIRKFQYIKDMEKRVSRLQDFVSFLTPQVDSHKEKRKLLALENDSLQKLVEIRLIQSKLDELELEKKKDEICKLQELEKLMNKNSHDTQQIQCGDELVPSKQFVEKCASGDNQDEAKIDQYFNFEALNLHTEVEEKNN